MAISDLILQLGNQAKQLEATASALHTDNGAELKARQTELRTSLAKVKSGVDEKLHADSEVAAERMAGLQRTLSEGFEALRTDRAARGKLDAEDAIALAVHALQETEYLLAAVAARDDGDPITSEGGKADPAAESEGKSADVPPVDKTDAVVTDDTAKVPAKSHKEPKSHTQPTK